MRKGTEIWYELHEGYYDDNAQYSGRPDSLTIEPISPCGDTVEELRECLKRMLRALDKPVIDYDQWQSEISTKIEKECDICHNTKSVPVVGVTDPVLGQAVNPCPKCQIKESDED